MVPWKASENGFQGLLYLLFTNILQTKMSCSCLKPEFSVLAASPCYTYNSVYVYINLAHSETCNTTLLPPRAGPPAVYQESCSVEQVCEALTTILTAVLVPGGTWSHSLSSLLFVFTSLLKVLQVKLLHGSHCHLWYFSYRWVPSARAISSLCKH